MPVFSYIAQPVQGAKSKLLNILSTLDYCEVIPSQNQEILVLVTDTPDEENELNLQKKLKNLECLQSLSMTFGHNGD